MSESVQEKYSPRWGSPLLRILGLMTAGDVAILAIVVAAALVLVVVLPGMVLSGGNTVEIRSGDRLVGRFALDSDRVVEVPGPLGTTVVRIKGGRARIDSSPCPKGICKHMGDIGKEGGMLACVPNEVVVQVSGHGEDVLDGVSR